MSALQSISPFSLDADDLRKVHGQRAKPYLGPVATRGIFASTSSTSLKQAMSESPVLLVDDVEALVLVFPNAYVNGGDEIGPGFSIDLTCSAENLTTGAGVRVQGLFHTSVDESGNGVGTGNVVGTIANKTLGFAVVPITGKAGDEVMIRSYQNSAGGILYTDRAGPRDKMAYGASGVADQTMSGNVVSGAGTNVYKPIAVLGITTKATVFLAGDSIQYGYGSPYAGDWSGLVGVLARIIGLNFGYINGSISSANFTKDNNPANYVLRLALSQYCSHVISQGGINDVSSAASAAALATLRGTFAAKFGGKPVIGCTLGPSNQSSDGWTTLANQTQSNATVEARRVAFNNLVRAGITGERGYFDIADALESDRDSGKWAVGYLPGATTGIALCTDGLHPNADGERRVRRLLTPRPTELIWR